MPLSQKNVSTKLLGRSRYRIRLFSKSFNCIESQFKMNNILSLPGVAGDGSGDLYHIKGPSHTIFVTNYDSPNWSRDLEKFNF